LLPTSGKSRARGSDPWGFRQGLAVLGPRCSVRLGRRFCALSDFDRCGAGRPDPSGLSCHPKTFPGGFCGVEAPRTMRLSKTRLRPGKYNPPRKRGVPLSRSPCSCRASGPGGLQVVVATWARCVWCLGPGPRPAQPAQISAASLSAKPAVCSQRRAQAACRGGFGLELPAMPASTTRPGAQRRPAVMLGARSLLPRSSPRSRR